MDETYYADNPEQIASLHLKHWMEYAMLRGIPEQKMRKAPGAPQRDPESETATVLPGEFYTVLQVIDEHLGDDLVGIRAGRFLNLKALGLIYKISLQAVTMEEALFYLKDYMNETFPILILNTEISDPFISISVDIENSRDRLNRLIFENLLTVMGREIKMMTGDRTNVTLYTPHHSSQYPGNWSGGRKFELRFRASILQAALKDKSQLHLDLLIPDYLKLIESLKSDGSFSNRTKIAALNLAGPELPDLKTVAGSFNLTPRTLQRRLQREGTNFRELSDELKRKISEMLLHHQRFSVDEVSLVLGYSEPAAFIHAFKRWHETSPQKFRESVSP